MKEEIYRLMSAFKRVIHVLTTGKNTPFEYGGTILFKAEVHILEIIGEHPGITASEIIEKIDVTKGAISQIVRKLYQKNLIIKSAKEENLRTHELYVTKKGMEVLSFHEEHEKEIVNFLKTELQDVRKEDIEKFIRILNKVIEFIDR